MTIMAMMMGWLCYNTERSISYRPNLSALLAKVDCATRKDEKDEITEQEKPLQVIMCSSRVAI